MDIVKRLRRVGLPRLIVHASVLIVVLLWLLPTLGILVSSLRDKDQITVSGWWTAFSSSEQTQAVRLADASAQKRDGSRYVISGNVFENGQGGKVAAFGVRVQEPTAFKAGEAADIGDGETLLINEDGTYEYSKAASFEGSRGKRVYISVATPPVFTLDNYRTVLTSEGIGQSFVNSLTVAVPATVIPILIAAFAAYALSWMNFSGRNLLIAMVVGLIVVPLQMSLIPLLRLYNEIGTIFGVPSKTYAGIWLAHTAFGLPLAIYLLRNYISGLPKEIIESARVDGASDFEIFVKIILPLSFPALASFAIFQFLWTWNDLLVAMVFLGTQKDELVLTGALNALLGSRGGNWEILTASAFVTIVVPLGVFFALQRYLVRGLLAGSVKEADHSMNAHTTQDTSMTASVTSALTPNKDWWRGAVIYQIYPRSYQDSNGDGIGDLKGITDRLHHIAGLGADAIWISPFFTSPMKDFGYDVSNYVDVDPMFGTLADFDGLIAEAHRLGIRVMIDLVLSHTSDQHPWFVESRASRNNAKSDWYVWSDSKPDGTPPNNWLSIFGGSGWQWDPTRMQYYMHNFLTSQPDLNLHNPEVQEELLNITRFWLKRGVDGFRLDTINFYFHDLELRDNPALAPERRNASTAPAVNPYNFQEHLYDKNRPENIAFLKRFRAVLDEFPDIAAVGEVGDSQRGLEIVGEYTSGDDKMQMCYAFEFLAPDALTPQRVADVQADFARAAPEGWACWAFSNHDVVRHVSRWGEHLEDKDAFAKVLSALLMTQRGSVCIYEGEELGLTEADIAFEDLQDPYGIQFWPEFKGRDGCRTPMVWDAGHAQAGFSTADKTWLPIPTEHKQRAVSAQQGNEASVLEHYRRFLAFRRQHPAFAKGGIEFQPVQGEVLSYTRKLGNETVLCVFNLSATPAEATLPEGNWEVLEGHGFASGLKGRSVELPAWGAFFARYA